MCSINILVIEPQYVTRAKSGGGGGRGVRILAGESSFPFSFSTRDAAGLCVSSSRGGRATPLRIVATLAQVLPKEL